MRPLHILCFIFSHELLTVFIYAASFGPYNVIIEDMTACVNPGTNQINFSNFTLVERVYDKRTKKKAIPVFSYKMVNEYPINSKTQLAIDLYFVKTKKRLFERRLGGFCQLLSSFIPSLYENFLLANGVKQCIIPKGNHTIERFKLDANPQFPNGPYGKFKADIIVGVKGNSRVGCFSLLMNLIEKEDFPS